MRNGIQVRWEPAGASSHNVCWRNGLYFSRRFSRGYPESFRTLLLLQPLRPLFQRLQSYSERDPRCVLHSVVRGRLLGNSCGWLVVTAAICEQGEHLSRLDSIILLSSSCQQWTETRQAGWSGQWGGHCRSLERDAAQGGDKGGGAERMTGRTGEAER